MWVARLRVRHDCVIGNRCRKFRVTTTGIPFGVYVERGITYSPQVQAVQGPPESVRDFISDLSSDKRVTHFEAEGSTVFFVEVRKDKIPSSFCNEKLIFVKPVFVDNEGFEHWEVASWKNSILKGFVSRLSKEMKELEIEKITETALIDIYFARLFPVLTGKQKRAIELAFESGFYAWPKRASLGKLARQMKVSVATFREHLKRAEEKVMPDIIRSIQ